MKAKATPSERGSSVLTTNRFGGKIELTIDGQVHTFALAAEAPYVHELIQAHKNRQNAAEAAEYLLRQAVRKLNPHHFRDHSRADILRWEEMFGPTKKA